MRQILILATIAATLACGGSSPTAPTPVAATPVAAPTPAPAPPPPAPIWTLSGSGNTVFDLPASVSRVRIQGRWNQQDVSNFIVRISGRLVVNEILRTTITYDGTHLVPEGNRVVEVTNSSTIAWTFTEVR